MMRYFPKDCPRYPKQCKHFRSWDLSIDDYTNVCGLLHVQIDDYDCMNPLCPVCPLTDEKLQESLVDVSN